MDKETSVYDMRITYPLNGAKDQTAIHNRLKDISSIFKEHGFSSVEVMAVGLLQENGDLDMRTFKNGIKY
jgi:hypothetical protein